MSPPADRAIVEDVFSRAMTTEIWTGNFQRVLPISIQDFDLSAILPAVFFMFRNGHRRGKGTFFETFGADTPSPRERRRSATVERVARRLSSAEPSFQGFESESGQAILGDLLLCFCLENAHRALGRSEQIQRVAPAHFMASWVDLPDKVAHLRFVPEMIVAMLADQTGDIVEETPQESKTLFGTGRGVGDNVLVSAFSQGVVWGVPAGNRVDRFDERTPVGFDQLLMIRLAQVLGRPPDKLRGAGGDRISNQRPIAEQSARMFSEDIRRFVRSYAGVIPRHAFVGMLESCMAVGLTTIFTSVVDIVVQWAEVGAVPPKAEQLPPRLFIDCSHGVNRHLRSLAEQSFDDFQRRVERFPVILMAMRLLDWYARHNPQIRRQGVATGPYATEWLALLGDLLHRRHGQWNWVVNNLEEKAAALAESLSEERPDVTAMLDVDTVDAQGPVWPLAEALTLLQGRVNVQANLVKFIDSCLLTERPNGLAAKRRVSSTGPSAGKKTREARSLVLTDPALDYLVHLNLLPSGHRRGVRSLSLREFLRQLSKRYGLCIDEAPAGMTISNDLLQANRAVLERRLRDLGLLFGVNDAEGMKRLRPRFEPAAEVAHADP